MAGLPSRRGYVIAAIVAVLGLALGVAGLLTGFAKLGDQVEAFKRVDVPGHELLELTGAGDFTIYYEATEAGKGSLPPINIGVAAVGPQPIHLRNYGGSLNYSVRGYEGRAVATFHVDQPGTYVITSEGAIPPGIAHLAIGRSLGSTLARTVLPGALLFVALVVAAVVAGVTFLRRRRSSGLIGSISAAGQPGSAPDA